MNVSSLSLAILHAMEEVNAPANQAKGARGEDVVIPAERFDRAMTPRRVYWASREE